jgi:serine/threonine protein kinase
VFSIGAVAYELLTGKLPCGATVQDREAFREVAITPPQDYDREVPTSLNSLVMRCLATNPEHRHANAGELRAALAGIVQTLPYHPTPPKGSRVQFMNAPAELQ